MPPPAMAEPRQRFRSPQHRPFPCPSRRRSRLRSRRSSTWAPSAPGRRCGRRCSGSPSPSQPSSSICCSAEKEGDMIPSAFDYHAPASLPEAIALLSKLGDSAKVISGGQSLLPLLKLRLGAAEHLVDIGRIPGLEYVREEGGFLRIGGRTREALLERSEVVQARYPILLDTAKVIADPLVRNRATVGGNLAHGDPANDHPATMLALRAQVVAQGPQGERVIPIDDFFVGLFTTALSAGEILTEIRLPTPPGRRGGA